MDNGACDTCGFDTKLCQCSSTMLGTGLICTSGWTASCTDAYEEQWGHLGGTYYCSELGVCNEVTDPW